MEREKLFEEKTNPLRVRRLERVEFQKWHSGFQCMRQIIVCKSNFACSETLQHDENFITKKRGLSSLLSQLTCLYTGVWGGGRFASMTCVFSLVLLDFCWFCHKCSIQNLCCLISVVLTGDVISLIEALTTVKALLKAL